MPFISPLSGPFPVLLRLSWNAETTATQTTVASILKRLLQGQGPHLYIHTDGQQGCSLPKVTQSENNRAQQWRIPVAVISAPHPTDCLRAGLQMGTCIRQGALSSKQQGRSHVKLSQTNEEDPPKDITGSPEAGRLPGWR